jgi:two-component system, OmpR family, sensor histidine kinase CiaH
VLASTWQALTRGFKGTYLGGDEGLRRVALRLAAQTVGLLLVMLLVLEIVVYLVTQHALLNSLQTTLSQSAHATPDDLFHPSNRNRGPGGPDHGAGPGPQSGSGTSPPPFHEGHPSEVSTVFLNPQLHVLGSGFGPLGTAVIDPSAVRQSLRTGREVCCSISKYHDDDYLVYTDVVRMRGSGTIIAVAQSNISAHQYEETLESLQEILLLAALLGLLASAAISAILVTRALRPIRTAIRRQRDFVADAAHELRTPLAIMRTVGEVGLNDHSGEEQQATIEQMLAENAHLTRLVNDLSLLARADTRAIGIDRVSVHLSALVTDTTSELHPLAEEQGIALTADVQPATWVSGDTLRLRQLLLILLDNALKHTPEGGNVHVALSHAGSRARLQVVDSGPGIPPADLPRIFDRFYRSDAARTGEGSGLGLSIGKWISEAHGGQITASNGPHGGAVFTVTLPLTRVGTSESSQTESRQTDIPPAAEADPRPSTARR